MSATLPPAADLERPSDFGEFWRHTEAAPRPASVLPEAEVPLQLLTPEQHARRLRLRRAVGGVMLSLLAFTTLAACVYVVKGRHAPSSDTGIAAKPVSAAANGREPARAPATAPMAQPATIALMAQPAMIAPMAQPAMIAPMAQPAMIAPMAQPAMIAPMAQPAMIAPMAQPVTIAPPSGADQALALAPPPMATVATLEAWSRLAGQLSFADRQRVEQDLSRSSVKGARATQEAARLELALLWRATARRAKAQKVLMSLARTAADPLVKKYAIETLSSA